MQPDDDISCGVVIVAAGRGERAGSSAEGPKQYRRIGGRPVICHTLDIFASWPHTAGIVVVIHPDDEALFARALDEVRDPGTIRFVHGGPTRQASVLAGLEALDAATIRHVMIQDAVRPFVDHDLLDRSRHAFLSGAIGVLPAIAVADTLKRGNGLSLVTETVPRAGLFSAQTPQSFAYEPILKAHRRARDKGASDFTDDASIAEWAGIPVLLIEGLADNVKLTLKRDMAMADERLHAAALPDVRTGNGYDVHALIDGDGVTLCGVFIAHDQSLLGHSDADVALHALTDALLATCGAGDIGDHFPPSDPQWRGAPSRIFLEHAAKIVRDHGGIVMNADVSLIAEAPKIGPHRQAMRENLAAILDISLERCSVKATTNEKIGFVGRREGIAAIATATVVFGRKDKKMSPFPQDVQDKAQAIITLFAERGLKVATAESCTGGLIAAALTDISGSSAVVDRGFVTYSNAAKMDMLDVQSHTLNALGAVSRQTALEMAEGALAHSRADIAVSVTGIAGPGGGSADKPVGLVHLAVIRRGCSPIHREMRYGDIGRTEVRLATLRTALDLMLEAAQTP